MNSQMISNIESEAAKIIAQEFLKNPEHLKNIYKSMANKLFNEEVFLEIRRSVLKEYKNKAEAFLQTMPEVLENNITEEFLKWYGSRDTVTLLINAKNKVLDRFSNLTILECEKFIQTAIRKTIDEKLSHNKFTISVFGEKDSNDF
jgi:hypothetical protein